VQDLDRMTAHCTDDLMLTKYFNMKTSCEVCHCVALSLCNRTNYEYLLTDYWLRLFFCIS